MSLKDDFNKMMTALTTRFAPPPIADVFFPPFCDGGQPKDSQFMAIRLEDGATGISFLLVPDEKKNEYSALHPQDFIGKEPRGFALEFGSDEPVREMISLGAINAICQHVMRETRFEVESAPDPLGLLSISEADKIGIVGLFFGLTKAIKKAGAELIVIEKKHQLLERFFQIFVDNRQSITDNMPKDGNHPPSENIRTGSTQYGLSSTCSEFR